MKSFGKFELVRKIQSGGFGDLWEAREKNKKDKVALKILRHPEGFSHFQTEIEVLKKLNHPGIALPLEWDLEHDPPYVALEYVEGQTLRQILQKHPQGLPLEKVCQWGFALLDILEDIHQQGFVHCDIKPENIIIQPDQSLKLLDFGLAYFPKQKDSQLLLSGLLDTASREGKIAGTLQYMAPEQKQGEPVGPDTDIYSFGVLLFEMLTGELPELGELPSFYRSLPKGWDDLYLKCVSKRPHRFTSVKDVKKALKALAPLPPEQPPTPQEVLPTFQKFCHKVTSACLATFSWLYWVTKVTVLTATVCFFVYLGFAAYFYIEAYSDYPQVNRISKKKSSFWSQLKTWFSKRQPSTEKPKEASLKDTPLYQSLKVFFQKIWVQLQKLWHRIQKIWIGFREYQVAQTSWKICQLGK